MIYSSTRNEKISAKACEAIVNGISEDGGLYIPNEIPSINIMDSDLANLDYKELAYIIMIKFLTDFNDQELKACIDKAYDSKFEDPRIAPLSEHSGVYFLELYHGPTLAFKDIALSILPHLLKTASEKLNIRKKIVILTATSGDTGKAALQGFANIDDIKIIVFYPRDGVSEIQKAQMVTQEGSNTFVVGIEGNFDDAQNGVKKIFNDTTFGEELDDNDFILTSANSINIGRLIPQIVYYFYGYFTLLKNNKIRTGECVNFVVPTGNFGNILAGYYAKKMGLPINKLICASNENNVLHDFIKTGIYNRLRKLILTSSPSMDILISSNLERLLYEISNHDAVLIKNLMETLSSEGKYEVTEAMRKNLDDFYANYSTEAECRGSIKSVFESSGYVIDTHTAVAYSVYKKYIEETEDKTPSIIVSTASPFKFGRSVAEGIGIDVNIDFDDFKINELISNTSGITIPESISLLKEKKIIHNINCKKLEMQDLVRQFLLQGSNNE